MDYLEHLIDKVKELKEVFDSISLDYNPPLTEEEMLKIEAKARRPFPSGLRRFYLKQAGKLEFDFDLDLNAFSEDEGFQNYMVDSGTISLNPDDFFSIRFNWLGFEETSLFKHFKSEGGGDLDIDDFFPLISTMNGDFIVEVVKGPLIGKIYYINHEDLYSSTESIANSFDEFMESWVTLLGVGPEIWALEKFLDSDGLLSLKTDNSQKWLNALANKLS